MLFWVLGDEHGQCAPTLVLEPRTKFFGNVSRQRFATFFTARVQSGGAATIVLSARGRPTRDKIDVLLGATLVTWVRA